MSTSYGTGRPAYFTAEDLRRALDQVGPDTAIAVMVVDEDDHEGPMATKLRLEINVVDDRRYVCVTGYVDNGSEDE